MAESQNKYLPIYAVFYNYFKTYFLLTHYIQEDAFITWRVAQNLMDYGVIGFNGILKFLLLQLIYMFLYPIFSILFSGKKTL
jgi:hypothetical protein